MEIFYPILTPLPWNIRKTLSPFLYIAHEIK